LSFQAENHSKVLSFRRFFLMRHFSLEQLTCFCYQFSYFLARDSI